MENNKKKFFYKWHEYLLVYILIHSYKKLSLLIYYFLNLVLSKTVLNMRFI